MDPLGPLLSAWPQSADFGEPDVADFGELVAPPIDGAEDIFIDDLLPYLGDGPPVLEAPTVYDEDGRPVELDYSDILNACAPVDPLSLSTDELMRRHAWEELERRGTRARRERKLAQPRVSLSRVRLMSGRRRSRGVRNRSRVGRARRVQSSRAGPSRREPEPVAGRRP